GLGLLYIISSVITYFTQRTLARTAQRTAYTMRRQLDEKLSKLPLKYFDTKTRGEIMSRVTNDVDNINNAMQQGMSQLIGSVIGIIGAVVMMLIISPLLTLITIITLPLSFGVTMFIAKNSQKYFAAQQKSLGELNGHIEEMFTGHRIVKAFGYEKKSIERFGEINTRLFNSGWKSQFISGFIFPVMNFINNLGYVAVCVAGGIFVVKKTIEIGDVQAFIQYIRMFTQPVAQSASVINMLQSAVASAERIFEVLDETEETSETEAAVPAKKTEGRVIFDNVKFGYTPEKILFESLSLNVEPGHTIAIVGPTGAGKTTLVNLLMRFYEITGGAISVDGVDTRNLKRGNLRRMFGMVLQDTWLFSGTIRDNIAYARPGAADEEIFRAAKAARADHFINALPGGYATVLNEDASNISQGEKQLITIARAVLADPSMLILDEATSSVDTRTEVQIQHAMKELMKERTSFVIAHRLSTIKDAEMILVMNEGAIVEKGTHEGLIKAGGFYSQLYRAQFTAGETA
ncbi:MAG: ABC transporter ATP-binding protein, partial [Candidatus Goldiibacteriota bacterium]